MGLSVIIIVILIGLFSVYIFYLIGIYVKLENRRSLILSKFSEVDKQIENKLELIKKLEDLLKDEDLSKVRSDLFNSVSVNDKIKYNKIIDSIIGKIENPARNVKNILKDIEKINEKIAYSKEFYNDSLYEYNIILNSFSGKILKKICKYSEYNTF